jgi:hypothetical protein
MDFDVFGSTESKVVIIGEDNVVIVKDKEVERVSNEEIPQAISELKIDTTDDPSSQVLAESTNVLTEGTTVDLTTSVVLDTPQKVD